jgi:Lon protease-like protein
MSSMTQKMKISVFPLPQIVMFPHTALPLFIIEPTYLKVMRKICEQGDLIAVSWAQEQVRWDGKIKYNPQMVCTATKPVIIEEQVDGLKIMMHGQFRAKLTHVIQNLPTLIFEAYPLPDQKENIVLPHDIIQKLKIIFDKWLVETIQDSLEREHFQKQIQTLQQIVDHICLYVIQDKETKQLLLETCSLKERLYMLNGLLRGEDPLSEDVLVRNALKNFEQLERMDGTGH